MAEKENLLSKQDFRGKTVYAVVASQSAHAHSVILWTPSPLVTLLFVKFIFVLFSPYLTFPPYFSHASGSSYFPSSWTLIYSQIKGLPAAELCQFTGQQLGRQQTHVLRAESEAFPNRILHPFSRSWGPHCSQSLCRN